MSGQCCGPSPRVWRDNKWKCSECGSNVPDHAIPEQIDFFGYTPPYTPRKCDCGAESLYGSETPGHYPMCSKLK